MYRLIGSTHSLSGLPGATADFLRALDSMRKSLADNAGLSGTELRAMAQIAEADGATPKQLAQALEVTNGAISAVTSGLVSRGLVVRHQHPTDRRSLVLSLTESGHELMQGNYRRFQDAISTAASTLTDTTEAELATALHDLTEALRARDF